MSSTNPSSSEKTETREERRARREARREERRKRRKGAVPVVERNQALALVSRRLIGLAIIATIAALVSVFSAVGIYEKPVAPVYVPVTNSGRLLPLVPVSKPNVGLGEVGSFALDAVRAVNTYDYINFRNQLNAASVYFTPKGWNQYQQQLKDVRTIKAVEARKMIVSVKPTGAVTVPAQGVRNGFYTWRVEVPVEITYTAHVQTPNGAEDTGNKMTGTITLFVTRVPTTINPRGLAVDVYQFKPDQP